MIKYFSLSTLCFGVVCAYVSYTIWTMAQLFVPPKCPVPEDCLVSFLSDKPSLDLYLFSSVNQELKVHDSVKLVDYMKNFSYLESWERGVLTSWISGLGCQRDKQTSTPKTTSLYFKARNSGSFPSSIQSSRKIFLEVPKAVRDNGTLYLHLFAVPSSPNLYEQWFKIIQNDKAAYCRVKLTQLHVPDSYVFNLLKKEKLSEQEYEEKKKQIRDTAKPVSHLKSKVTVNMLTEPLILSRKVPSELYYYIRLAQNKKFLPIITYNFLETRLEDLKLIKNTTEEILLKYSPTYYGKLMVMMHVENTVLTLRKMGFSVRDIDDIKSFFAGTNFYLLCITIVVSSFHLLFDFLAFKNDVKFWKNKSTLEGLSLRTVLWRAFSHTVVMLYLFDERASPIVLGPSGIATIIELWKVVKVVRRLRSKESSASEKLTNEYDAESMRYLSFLLYPLCVAGAIYSLFYLPHKSWYSWCIHSLVNCVYAFGFLFMLPQLFVNYRLKSVEALPWKAFMYKGFNTFIDDLFAFIITMPTAHRVACFRDDVIFLIYLYQRWLYPVDKNRISESTPFSNNEVPEEKEEKKKK